VSSSDGLYKDWPIEVQVFDNSAETETVKTPKTSAAADIAVSLGPEPKRKLTFLRRPFIKPAAAAAAVILIALLLIPPAGAVDLDRMISKALERIDTVRLETFATSDTEEVVPIQEIWMSQALNYKLYKTGPECVLWDNNTKSKTTRDLNTGSIATIPLNTDVFLNVKETVRGLLPLNSMHEVPEGAKWLPVADEDIETAISNMEVYELIWTEKPLIGSINRKRRVYVDIETKRPKRIEWLVKLAEEQDYKCETTTRITYPDTDEMKAVIKEAGF
jgi:hypothetical protein